MYTQAFQLDEVEGPFMCKTVEDFLFIFSLFFLMSRQFIHLYLTVSLWEDVIFVFIILLTFERI